MFSLESPHRGDSNEYTQYTIFNIKKKITLNYPKSAVMDFYSKGLKNEFETAVVNEPSVLETLKFYCIWLLSMVFNGCHEKQVVSMISFTLDYFGYHGITLFLKAAYEISLFLMFVLTISNDYSTILNFYQWLP